MKRPPTTSIPNHAGSDIDVARRLEVRWTSTVSRWIDPFRACEHQAEPHSRVALVLVIDACWSDGSCPGQIDAWLETPNGRRALLDREDAICTVSPDDEFLHIDIEHDGADLATLTVNGQARVLYARTRLLADVGMSAGRIDPPTVRWQTTWSDDVASAGVNRARDVSQPHDVQ